MLPRLEIVVPAGAKPDEEAKLVVLFLHALLSEAKPEQFVEVSNGMVISGNAKLRELLTMVFRAKRFDEFIGQLKCLLHVSDGALGVVRCVYGGQAANFRITEQKSMPRMQWKIDRVS